MVFSHRAMEPQHACHSVHRPNHGAPLPARTLPLYSLLGSSCVGSCVRRVCSCTCHLLLVMFLTLSLFIPSLYSPEVRAVVARGEDRVVASTGLQGGYTYHWKEVVGVSAVVVAFVVL